ncbi:MAG: hypothetical protein KGJ62_12050 [Armatimonadetes bacterium]|nr:hypothetical protein [Armatimonadota bacterium]MDE2206390.1 hypothetical protein [Armatimonadota bacterium]
MSILYYIIEFVVVTVIYGLPVYIIARKCEHELAWLAWIPFGFLWLQWDLSGVDTIWLLLSFVPVFGTIGMAVIWMGIAETTNKPAILGVLMVIPLVNLPLGYSLATYEPRERGQRGALRTRSQLALEPAASLYSSANRIRSSSGGWE